MSQVERTARTETNTFAKGLNRRPRFMFHVGVFDPPPNWVGTK
jgi:hypothetical protein